MPQKRVAVVTGSNKGIGFAIVKGLCQAFSGDVYLTARDEARGLAAVKSLNDLGFYPKFHQLDITDEHSIIRLKNHLIKEYGGLNVLVNNAGIGRTDDMKYPPFAIETIQTNYFATKHVCDALFPILRPHARIVNMSSRYGLLFMIPSECLREKISSKTLGIDELDELMRSFIRSVEQNNVDSLLNWGNNAYLVSKVGVSVLTRLHQKEFLEDVRGDIIVNSVHPGYVDSDMTCHKGPLSTDQGAIAPLYAALLPKNVTGPKGAFIWENKDLVDWEAPLSNNFFRNFVI